MNIKSLLTLTIVSSSILTSTGHANLTPESEASLNNAARTCAIIATASRAALLTIPNTKIPHTNENKYITEENERTLIYLKFGLNRLQTILNASTEGSSDSNWIMRINRCIEVLSSIQGDDKYFMQWAKDMNTEKAKKLVIGLANFALKEVIYDQAGKIVTANVTGADTNKRVMRRGITIITNILVESLLDAVEALAKDKILKKSRYARDPNYTEILCNTAIKTGIMTAFDQTVGELIRRGYETNTEEAQQLNEAVNAIEPAVSTENCSINS